MRKYMITTKKEFDEKDIINIIIPYFRAKGIKYKISGAGDGSISVRFKETKKVWKLMKTDLKFIIDDIWCAKKH